MLLMTKKLVKIISLCIVSVLFLIGCTNRNSYVAKINEEEISKSEFMIYLYEAQKNFETIGGSDIWDTDFEGRTAQEVAKDSALNALQTVVISAQKAPKYHISLSEEEKQTAQEEAKNTLESMTDLQKEKISTNEKELYDIMMKKLLYGKVYDEVTKSFELSEADFQNFYTQEKEQYRDMYTKFTIKMILIENRETANEVAAKAKAGEDFQQLFETYESDEEEKKKNSSMEVYKGQLESLFNIKFNLEIGAVTDALETPEGYYVIKIEDKQLPTEEELLEKTKQSYISMMQQQLFNDEYQKWLNESKIEKNEAVWNEIELIP